MRKSLVLFSGGLDSFLSLLIAKRDGGLVTPVFFNYGQNPYEIEKEAVKNICELLELTPVEIDLTSLGGLLSSSYTSGEDASTSKVYNSYVPNRNLLFLTLASSYAHINDYKFIYSGFYYEEFEKKSKKYTTLAERVDAHVKRVEDEVYISTLHSDQTKEFLDSVGAILKASDSYNEPVLINCLESFNKVQILNEIESFGYLKEAILYSRSCYSTEIKVNDWGVGCGKCSSCEIREDAFNSR